MQLDFPTRIAGYFWKICQLSDRPQKARIRQDAGLQRVKKPLARERLKAPLCKGSWICSASAEQRLRDCMQKSSEISHFYNPSVKNQIDF